MVVVLVVVSARRFVRGTATRVRWDYRLPRELSHRVRLTDKEKSDDGGDELLEAVGNQERLDELMAKVPPAQSWSSWLGISSS